ncbi:MAG TPA: riboflavin biosynthesis protein RibF, partial [Clostridiales bacterium]|nr:riboflavin biosynthesis protein RibF [Clostridiales bacterium]
MKEKTIYALGFFDGVHIGHAALLKACRELAAEARCRFGVITFGVHPDALVLGQAPRLINTLADRERLLRENFGVETVATLPFDENMHSCPWRDFLDMLRRDYGAAGFVCGEDFRFGAQGAGNALRLAHYCRGAGLAWAVVPEQTLNGVRISSTYIRARIEDGDMATAVKFLGHPQLLTGTVVH